MSIYHTIYEYLSARIETYIGIDSTKGSGGNAYIQSYSVTHTHTHTHTHTQTPYIPNVYRDRQH